METAIRGINKRLVTASFSQCKHCGLAFDWTMLPCQCPDAEAQIDEIIEPRLRKGKR